MSKKVLVVDDDDLICRSIKKILDIKDYDVDFAESAKEALKKFKGSNYDVVLADVRMPKMDGIEMVKEMESEKATRCVFMTGYPEERNRNKLKDMPNLVLDKPFSLYDLIDAVSNEQV